MTTDAACHPPTHRRAGLKAHPQPGIGKKLGVIPDRVFGLEFTGAGGETTRAVYFLEADRGTMPAMRQSLSQSSFYRKMLAYEATWTRTLHRSRLGLNRFRVLTVTSSPERVKTLVEACRQLERGRGLFLFSDADSFRGQANPLALPWISAREDASETLLDSFSPSRPFFNN